MEHPREMTFGFEYEHEGRRFAFDLVASSLEEAMRRVASVAQASYVGKLHRHTDATPDSTYLSSI